MVRLAQLPNWEIGPGKGILMSGSNEDYGKEHKLLDNSGKNTIIGSLHFLYHLSFRFTYNLLVV
jgi:hypothetical protein